MKLAAAALLAGVLLLPPGVRAFPQDAAPNTPQVARVERVPTLADVTKAYQASQFVSVSRDADILLKGNLTRSDRAGILYMAAVSDARRGGWDDCLRHGKQYEEEAQGQPISILDHGGYVLLAMAEADIAQGRVEEGAEVLDRLPVRYPTLLDYSQRVTLRAVCRATGPVFIDRSYRGKYIDDERFAAALKAVEMAMPLAIAKIREECMDPSLVVPPIVVTFRDGSPENANGVMFTQSHVRDHRAYGVIIVTTQPLLTNSYELVPTLSHECIHAVRLACCGGLYRFGPPWLEEGVAEWGYGSGEGRMREMVLGWAINANDENRVTVSKALRSLAVLEEQEYQLQFICGSVIFWNIEQSKGKEVLRRVVSRLNREGEWRKVLEEELKCTVPQLILDTRELYIEWTPKAFPGAAVYKEASALMNSGKHGKAVALLDEYLEKNQSSPERPLMMLVRARALGDGGNRKAALECLRSIRLSWPRHPLVESSLWAEFYVLREGSDWPAVIALGNILLRDYCWQSTDLESMVRKALAEAEARLAANEKKPQPEDGK